MSRLDDTLGETVGDNRNYRRYKTGLKGWNTPEAVRRGVQSFQGDYPMTSVPKQTTNRSIQYHHINDDRGFFCKNWNNSAADHCGDQPSQGDHASFCRKRKAFPNRHEIYMDSSEPTSRVRWHEKKPNSIVHSTKKSKISSDIKHSTEKIKNSMDFVHTTEKKQNLILHLTEKTKSSIDIQPLTKKTKNLIDFVRTADNKKNSIVHSIEKNKISIDFNHSTEKTKNSIDFVRSTKKKNKIGSIQSKL